MTEKRTCPDRTRLESLLAGALTDAEQGPITEHVEGCESCQKTLDVLAGNSGEEQARRLADPPALPEPALKQVMRDALGGETQAADARTEDDAALAFLTPPRESGHLGRLGHYEVQKVLGKGGFGIVLKAFDERLQRVVAIKVLSPAFAANGSARKRFIREARAAAAVKNEHVVGIYDVQEEANPPYLVMELIDGLSLQDKLDRHGSLGVKEILRIGMQMAEGLAAAHKQGLVHRDIKPANILLENGVERVKITDFGLARAVDDASLTQSGTVAGTPMYMSPEQAEGLPIDHRSDLFSLGSVLYALCTGRPPFRASGTHAVLKRVIDASPRPIREISGENPQWLCDIVAKLHAKRPADRFQSAVEVAELLSRHLAHLQQPNKVAMPARVEVPKASSSRRKRWLFVAAPAALLAFVALVIFVWFRPTIERYFTNTGQLTANDFNPETEEFGVGSVKAAPKDSPENPDAEGAPGLAQQARVHRSALKSVCWIIARRDDGMGSSTGVLIDRENRLVLTSWHVRPGDFDYTVFFPMYDSENKLIHERDVYKKMGTRDDAVKGIMRAYDKTRDLAMIQLGRVPNDAEAIPFAQKEPHIGEEVHSISNPGASDTLWVFTRGHVRSIYKKRWRKVDENIDSDVRIVETDSFLNLGDSGGPLVNDRGELVGINQTGDFRAQGHSFFIHRTEIETFLKDAFTHTLPGKTWQPAKRPNP
jgi:S1-C subfamily serine protease